MITANWHRASWLVIGLLMAGVPQAAMTPNQPAAPSAQLRAKLQQQQAFQSARLARATAQLPNLQQAGVLALLTGVTVRR